jgi:hypothetical protein
MSVTRKTTAIAAISAIVELLMYCFAYGWACG